MQLVFNWYFGADLDVVYFWFLPLLLHSARYFLPVLHIMAECDFPFYSAMFYKQIFGRCCTAEGFVRHSLGFAVV